MMIKRALLATVLAGLHAGPAWAQRPEPIDEAMNACFAAPAGMTTMGQVECADLAATAWDKRLNIAYGKLMRSLDPASKASLVTAQRAWVDFRAKDSAFQAAPWRQGTGTLSRVVFASSNVEQLKARVRDLEFYLSGG